MNLARLFSPLALFALAAAPPEALADDGGTSPVSQAARDLATSRGTAAIVHAQDLWHLWALDAHGTVEQALRRAAAEPSRDAYERAYLRWLHGLARRRVGDAAGAERTARELGYGDDWMVLGPFENRENSGFEEPIVPELEDGRPLALGRTWTSKGHTVSFRHIDRAAPFGALDFGEFDTSEGGACWYAVARVKASGDLPFDGRVSLGSSGAVKVFVDGTRIGTDPIERGLDPERHAFPMTVDARGSRLVIKTCHRAHAPAMMVRVADANGEPTAKVRLLASPDIGGAATRGKLRPQTVPDAGLARRFESREHASVQDTRLLARYLAHTGGDDERGLHLRDLLDRLLKESPVADDLFTRFQLAGTRAERQELLARAAPLAKTRRERLELDVLRIETQRSGLAPSEALPLARTLLEQHPDDPRVIATLAEVEAQLGLAAAAAERLAQAVAALGPIPVLVEGAATQLANAGRREESARMVLLGLARASDRLAWHRERLAWAFAAGEVDVARALIARLDAVTGHSANLAIELAQGELRLGDTRAARDRLVAAAERRPSDARLWAALADLEVGAGHPEEAVAALRRASELAPEESSLRRHLEALTPESAHDDEAFERTTADLQALATAPKVGARRTLARVHVTTLYPTGLTAQFDQIAFQPLTDDAALEAREYSFGYDSARQVLQVRRARVLHADGSSSEATDIGQANTDDPSIAMYSSQRAVLVHFPRIVPGDIVEVAWRTDSLGGDEALREAFGETFALQHAEATLSADWVLRHPTSRTVHVKTTGPGAPTVTEETKGDRREVHVHASDLPAIALEPMGPPLDEVAPRVIASGFANWESIGTWYRRFVAHDLVADDALRRRAKSLGEGAHDVVDKVRAVYDWVVQSTRYVALEFGVHGYEPYPTWEVQQRGWGDCKDKASLIVVLLRELGVDAELVLLRTNPHGRRYDGIATHTIFDHAIAYVPALDLFLDGTAENMGMRELPWMDRGAIALRVTPEGGRFVTLPETSPDETFQRTESKVIADTRGGIELHWSSNVEGALAHDWRVRYGAEGTRKGRLEDDLASVFTGLRITSVTGGSLDDRTRGPALEVHAASERFVAKTDKAFAMPVAPSPFLETTYAALEARKSSLWFSHRAGHDDRWHIELPVGAQVDDVPSDLHLEMPFARFDRTVVRDGHHFTATTRWAFTANHIEPSDYPAFREFCRKVDRAAAERLRWRTTP